MGADHLDLTIVCNRGSSASQRLPPSSLLPRIPAATMAPCQVGLLQPARTRGAPHPYPLLSRRAQCSARFPATTPPPTSRNSTFSRPTITVHGRLHHRHDAALKGARSQATQPLYTSPEFDMLDSSFPRPVLLYLDIRRRLARNGALRGRSDRGATQRERTLTSFNTRVWLQHREFRVSQ
jgi:hypothetical protein